MSVLESLTHGRIRTWTILSFPLKASNGQLLALRMNPVNLTCLLLHVVTLYLLILDPVSDIPILNLAL